MKKLFVLFLIAASIPCVAQVTVSINWSKHIPSPKSDTIYYNSSRKLTWPDFKGTPGKPADALAMTSSGFGYSATMRSYNGKTDISVNVYCYFSKQNSWVRQGRESGYALNHEQHHFDVTYIVTDIFMQKLKTAAVNSKNYGDVIEKIYDESCRELEKMQNEYDGQTRNGILRNIQAEWNDKINKQLTITSN